MIPYETRQAILTLKAQGQPLREISRILKVSRNTVRRVLREPEPKAPSLPCGQEDVIALLPEIYPRCKGNAVRIQEILKDEHAIEVPYSTLTRLIREQELREPKKRSGIYTFGPGEEMQHDTSPHRLDLGQKTLTAQCASLILAYSRLLFFQYYPAFTRFEAKAFLTEALRFFDGSCPRCTIDNTSVIIAGGSGPDALIAPQMEAFGELFGTRFIPHAIGHSDRKGRIERPFSHIEGNFLAGRTFRDWADLNTRARQWCETTANAKPKLTFRMQDRNRTIFYRSK
jgi:transposase